MQKVIGGRLYDTETAELLCDISGPDADRGSFHYEDTWLYRTKNGRFFVAGTGNALSRWGQTVGNTHHSGGGLQLVTDDEARGLIGVHGSVALYKRVFGTPEEG